MILFLDFDGVLHPLLRTEPDFCRIELLWKILRACPDVDVVFSTSWREIYSQDELLELVTHGNGREFTHRFVGATPSIFREKGALIHGPHHRRHIECRLWLTGNGQYQRPWLAVDDIAVSFPPASPTLHLVDGATGLTESDVAAIIKKIQDFYI
ncbi:MAG TPA: hypothetical protein DE312_02590 [Gallionella sp.]|nr:MAG: hypothetical protein A2Z87_04265 [Gallionellales bacterium GWA2_54_124]HCI52214.1 hypothetical protein [Gallionella sp.]